MIRVAKRGEVEEELRVQVIPSCLIVMMMLTMWQVDELMREELKNLKAAVERDKGGKKGKKGKKSGKKKKGKVCWCSWCAMT
jgi:hypothetical protein